jgi:GTP-binding protein
VKFLDQAKIFLRSGDGGAGCVSFRREKFVEFGGPNGGDGGRGGDIILLGADNLNTLIDFRYQQHFKAPKGAHGMGKSRKGADGDPIILRVPVGTQVWNEHRDALLLDVTESGQKTLLLRGGRGGLGNEHFKSSTNRAPRYAQPGEEGEEMWVWLHLKLIADVGLIGLPNAGKSTFLSVVSQAKPKIADYPFTTLHPQLGVVRLDDAREFVIADLPGLIEGASQGKGLGDRFLGHAERCKTLIHLIDAGHPDIAAAYQMIRQELEAYGDILLHKPEVIALSKTDTLSEEILLEKIEEIQKIASKKPFLISSVTHQGISSLLEKIWTFFEPQAFL